MNVFMNVSVNADLCKKKKHSEWWMREELHDCSLFTVIHCPCS